MGIATAPSVVHRQILYTVLMITTTGNIFLLIHKRSPLIFYKPYKNDSLHCHLEDEDTLPIANNLNFSSAKQIFFQETSCKAGLDSRQACAIESAARVNPNWDINVFFIGSLSKLFLRSSLYELLSNKGNIHLYRVIAATFNYNTPMKPLMAAEIMFLNKTFCLEHMADMIRYLSLYKYGGVYIDLDVISVRSFDSLPPNWVVKQSSNSLGAGALGLSKNKVGRAIADKIIRMFSANFIPGSWSLPSTGVLTKVLIEVCATSSIVKMTNETCSGIAVFENALFYPIHYSNYLRYFQQGEVGFSRSYGLHIWNHISHEQETPGNSAYAKLARQFCPETYQLYGDRFGV